MLPEPGQIVHVRSRQYLVEEVSPGGSHDSRVRLSCVDDDAQGEELEVLWEREIDAQLCTSSWQATLHRGFDADIVAHFFRRAFGLLRSGGTFGLITTNTIAQGDTRATGLRPIRKAGGWLYDVTRRYKWPGVANVVVSVVHARKGKREPAARLDNKPVEQITAFLVPNGPDEDPATLVANAGRSFIGSYVLGMGFTFDDTTAEASPIAEMHRLIAADPRNAERIFPYIGGEEVNDSPMHAHRRYVINFGEMSEAEARRWPDLMEIVEAKVKPSRLAQNREVRARYWWRFAENTPALLHATRPLCKVIAISRVGQHAAFTFLPTAMVWSEQLVIVTIDSAAAFCSLQSRPHEIWARFFGSSMKDDLRYTPTDCFETFPFPPDWTTSLTLEAAGQAYYDFRAALMIRNNQGLTDTYNRFHDPSERDPDILRLRELHAAMDRVVLDAYGWTDIPTDCVFRLDYEEPEEDDEEAPKRRKKKPWRYRWPAEVHDEVLARLLALNRARADAEQRVAAPPEPSAPPTATGKPRSRPKRTPSSPLFDPERG
jgi:hypothetical protein